MLLAKDKVQKELEDSVTYFSLDLKKIRTGKVSTEVLAQVEVDAYGSKMTLNSVAQIQVEDAMNVKIAVWDKAVLPHVDKALREANLGGSVSIDKDFIRLKFNPMTEEDRVMRIKELNSKLEEFKVRVRQVRQKFKKELDSMSGVSEDDVKRSEEELQKMVDSTIKTLEELSLKKEAELKKV